MAKKTQSFEEAIKRLEEIVGMLENGDYPLEDSLSLFEEGAKLVKLCNTKLENVEKTINMLVEADGELVERKFKQDDEQ